MFLKEKGKQKSTETNTMQQRFTSATSHTCTSLNNENACDGISLYQQAEPLGQCSSIFLLRQEASLQEMVTIGMLLPTSTNLITKLSCVQHCSMINKTRTKQETQDVQGRFTS